MKYLYVTTATAVDKRELFTLGLGTKTDGTKIGHKGSGLKFTLALLHRLGSSMHVRTPTLNVQSFASSESIRGADHELITLRGPTESIDTHITVNAGSDTWTEPWFALRELVQNAMDEKGEYFAVDEDGTRCPPIPLTADYTIMRVLLTPPLLAAWEARDSWLHPRHEEVIYESNSPGLFYHGFLVYPQPAWRWAYDVTTLVTRDKLSEDRQIRNVNMQELFRAIAKHTLPEQFYDLLLEQDEYHLAQDVGFLSQAVYNALGHSDKNPGGFTLSKLEDSFERKHGARATYTCEDNKESSEWYFAQAAGYAPAVVGSRVYNMMDYSTRFVSANSCLPQVKNRLITVPGRVILQTTKDKLARAKQLTKRLCPEGCRVRVVKATYEGDTIGADALADKEANEVLMLESFLDSASENALVTTLIEEYVHISSGARDGSIQFQTALIAKIADLIRPRVRKPVTPEDDVLL